MTNPQESICPHENFLAHTKVGRLSAEEGGEITHFIADIKIQCADCLEYFDFIGLPIGLSAYRPSTSFDGKELHAPIMPTGKRPPDGLVEYSCNISPVEETHQ